MAAEAAELAQLVAQVSISSLAARGVRATLASTVCRRGDVERLGEVVGGAHAQRLDGGVDAGVAGDQHHVRAPELPRSRSRSMPLPSGSIRSMRTTSGTCSASCVAGVARACRPVAVVNPSCSTSSARALRGVRIVLDNECVGHRSGGQVVADQRGSISGSRCREQIGFDADLPPWASATERAT